MGLFLEINDQLAGIVCKAFNPSQSLHCRESDVTFRRILLFRMANMALHVSAGLINSPTGYI